MVETGYYYWFRLLSIAVIEQPGDRDRQSAKSLMALEGEANNYDLDNGPRLGIAKHRDKVVGAVLFQHSAVDESDDQIAAWCPRALCKQLEGTACTVVCDLVVDARSRQRGVGTRLLLHVLQRANLAESRLLIGRPTTATAAVGVLEGIGFERWSESGPDEKTPFGMLVRPTPPMW
jgi:ribosomal protein S18 acetylase RimI-like enzyme